MPRYKKALYSLKRPKCRPSWNKYNLYNILQAKNPIKPTMTYFQQKWYAKATTRAYHATTMKEKHWRRAFRPDMRSVVSMDADYLGKNDGSEISAGRGAGRDRMRDPNKTSDRPFSKPVPYMNMIYWQLERRLDVAIWRSLFASSVSQARQFVVHGGVKVNGRKMIYPGYLLNPGDMFQVDVEKVMFATGDRKNYWECRFGRQDRRRGYGVFRERSSPKELQDNVLQVETTVEEASNEDSIEMSTVIPDETAPASQSKNKLKELLHHATALRKDPDTREESASRKRSLREFARTVRKALGHQNPDAPVSEQILEMASKLSLDDGNKTDNQVVSPASKVSDARPLTKTLRADEERILSEALQELRDNPVDYTKGYKTPWQPRPYMSPFAFIPRYLEVHAPICAAVYLRHPVARAGLGEVPTPYGALLNGLTFNWYLRRR